MSPLTSWLLVGAILAVAFTVAWLAWAPEMYDVSKDSDDLWVEFDLAELGILKGQEDGTD